MILTVNIGNTNITLGAFENDSILFSARLASVKAATADEYAVRIGGVLSLHHIAPEQVEGAILGSVVPSLTSPVKAALEMLYSVRVRIVGPGMRSVLPLRIDNPSELGAELLCGAVAALQMHENAPSARQSSRRCPAQRRCAGWKPLWWPARCPRGHLHLHGKAGSCGAPACSAQGEARR